VADGATTGFASGLIGTVLSARYRLESKLGSGGMSTVYLAKDETLERMVAVKVLHGEISDQPDQIERFRREARAVAQLSHPNVVAVIDAGEDSGHPYIVFEYVEGETLKQRIDRLGKLPVDEAVAYAIEIGRGLQLAHARQLVHRDVKPQNVLIDSEGRAKVTDFGIARSLESDGLTKTGRVLGTTDYVSPEQAMGQDVDARSDVYSLAVLLYEMLTGKVPFEAETLVGVAMKHVNEPMPNVQQRRPEVSSAVAAAIERATDKEPRRRYEDMAGMLSDLEGALEVEVARGGGPHGEATTVIESVPEKRRLLPGRRASIAGIAIVAAAGLVALAIALFAGEDRRGGRGGGADVPSGELIPVAAAEDFDPEGDSEEHGEEAAAAIDEDAASSWSTETYDTGPAVSDSGKSGVGLVLDAGEPVEATSLGISSSTDGWAFEVYASDSGPPTALSGWGPPVAEESDVVEEANVELDLDGPAQYYLIWITELAEVDDGFRVEIGGASLSG
jgi:serine/threonine-protein kinase